MRNIELTATKVLPNLRHIWSEWEDHWWPKPLLERRAPAPVLGWNGASGNGARIAASPSPAGAASR
jgi:hypothetical protein